MPAITIFTPTYNRAYILPVLYESLQKQTRKDFEWLIVDDGSSDGTEELVAGWMEKETSFLIRYYKKENGGKPRAINYGVHLANSSYFFLMDSDDYLREDAVERLLTWIPEIDADPAFVGVGAAKGYVDGTYIKGIPPKVNADGYVDATNLERAQYHLDADMCEAYKTEIFKKFPMAEWPGEKFAPEQIALNEIALAGYKLRWHDEIIYFCEYREDGLTKGSALLEKRNPMGYAMMYNHMLKYGGSFVKKCKVAVQMTALSIYGGHIDYLRRSNCPIATVLTFPLGVALSVRRRMQYAKL